jgi:hypothetical protein
VSATVSVSASLLVLLVWDLGVARLVEMAERLQGVAPGSLRLFYHV